MHSRSVCYKSDWTAEFVLIVHADGGGVKGLSSLYILRGIMHEINKERRRKGESTVKPCQIFDLICGTSTGGYVLEAFLLLSDAH